ncbi:MAG: ATP-binding protein [Prevotella sp.]|nr:ATP-binding protein [Prevotella sp.]MCM1074286.1 ATP-binding protein [Ruminococcus sp.]
MKQMSSEYADLSLSTPFYEKPEFERSTDEVVKVMCATIIAAYKAGQTLHKVIVGLIDIVMKLDTHCTEQQAVGLVNTVLNCVRGRKLILVGLSWSDIDFQNNFELLAVKLSKMTFGEKTDMPDSFWCYYENSGLLAVSPAATLHIAALNNHQFADAMARRNLQDFIILPDLLSVQTIKGDTKRCTDFNGLSNAADHILRQLEKVKPSTPSKLKTYDVDDAFVVKVVKVLGIKYEAETVDPAYEKIRGNVLVETTDGRPSLSNLRSAVAEGDFLLVTRLYTDDKNTCVFALKETLEDEYRDYASSFANSYIDAVFIKDYSAGKEFVTREGFHVGVANGKLDELSKDERDDLEYCCIEGLPVPLRIYREAPDKNGIHFNVYAEVDTESLPSVSNLTPHLKCFTADEAEKNMLTRFMEWWKDDAEKTGMNIAEFRLVTPDLFIPVLSILHNVAEHGLSSCQLRLEFIVSTLILAKILGRTKEFEYTAFERTFLREEVNFAHGKSISPLKKNNALPDTVKIDRMCEIIDILSSYKPKPITSKVSKTAGSPIPLNDTAEIETEQTRALVNASNSLNEILDNAQLDSIKQYICRSLYIDDAYQSILDNRTFYGMESISLEFKSSAVYPPGNRRRYSTAVADPDLQKWAILKAVCGFLNSRSGGDLLIGVKDTGYACGIADDVKTLSKLGRLVAPTSDSYRIYIQNVIDSSFAVANADVKPQDVTSFYVDCALEENEEGLTILRVRVRPYPNGLVQFLAPDDERPQEIERSYIRQSGRTIPVTRDMVKAILKYKTSE